MGGSYSDLNVYFTERVQIYSESNSNYKVESTTKTFEGCSDFEVITHKITFTPPTSGRNYNVLLYDGSSDSSKGKRVFGYYYPSNDKEVIQEVRTYYSVLAPNVPLVVTFKTPTHDYDCCFVDLKNAGWDRAYNISAYSTKKQLKEQLDEEFKKLFLKRKIRFRIGSEKTATSGSKQELGGKLNWRFIFIPDGDKPVLGSECLFSIDAANTKPNGVKHNIDPYFFHPFNAQLYDGIMVYFAGEHMDFTKFEEKYIANTALLVEFIDSCKPKTQLKRMDNEGYWWSQEPVKYKDDDSLLKALKEIKDNAEKKNVNTILLDEKKQYLGPEFSDGESTQGYHKYTHKFNKPSTPVTLFARQQKIDSLTKSIKAQNVEVYYLIGKEGEDTEPFLIVFDQNGTEEKQKKTACHFAKKYNFEEWKTMESVEKLEDKLGKIADYGKCKPDLYLIRHMAYEILTGKEPKPTKPKDTTPQSRPPLFEPEKKPDPPPLEWIITGSVGGVVFVGSSAVGYGVYWYNTTIRLLT